MQPGFPTPNRNALLRALADDPRHGKQSQFRLLPPVAAPSLIRRSAAATVSWDLRRRMTGYHIQEPQGIGGKASKWVIQGPDGEDDFYIAKFGDRNGHIEILTELFNNMLGSALGFRMAHHGIVRLDDYLYFITRNFRQGEALVHGSLVIANRLAAREEELEGIDRNREQEFYSVDFLHQTIIDYCGADAFRVFGDFLQMLLFDALIGSQDRHAKNWGILRPQTVPAGDGYHCRLAPIFDSARALLWDLPEGKLLRLDADAEAMGSYLNRARPCIGPAPKWCKPGKYNHFEFVRCLAADYPDQIATAYSILADKSVCDTAKCLLRSFPFSRGFSPLRKRVILKVLANRERLISNALGREGEGYDVVCSAQGSATPA